MVGRIPYERIVYIDWKHDPSGLPRFYVVYTWRHEAFTDLALYEGSPRDHQFELHDIEYKGEGGGWIKRIRRRAEVVKFNLQHRREQKRWRDERYGDGGG